MSLAARITAYLTGGGLFNPELANHDAVRDLLIDCRDALESSPLTRGLVGDPSPMPPGSAGSHTPTDISAQVAPDSLVARLLLDEARACAKHLTEEGMGYSADVMIRLIACGEELRDAGWLVERHRQHSEIIGQLKDRLERVTQAARRYEWLRQWVGNVAGLEAAGMPDVQTPEEFDAAIDDAIRAEKDS